MTRHPASDVQWRERNRSISEKPRDVDIALDCWDAYTGGKTQLRS